LANWITSDKAAERLEGIAHAKWGNEDIDKRIVSAQNYIKAKLINVYGLSIVTGWTSATLPSRIAELTADLTAFLIKKQYMSKYKIDDIEKDMIFGFMDSLIAGEVGLIDSDGNLISQQSKAKVSTYGKPKTFTEFHPDEDEYGYGSLDDYGVPTVSDEDYQP